MRASGPTDGARYFGGGRMFLILVRWGFVLAYAVLQLVVPFLCRGG